MFRLFRFLLIPVASLTLTGCLGDLIGIACDFVPDGDHCYQAAAVQSADPYGC